ncbi:MAG: integration host factor subunit alpha [Magnetococcus sp. YQC-3]
MATTTKIDIALAVQKVASTSRQQSVDIVDAVLETLSQQLEQGRSVKLPGFGVFIVRAKHLRPGRNPKTGERLDIVARSVTTFRPSHILRARVAGPY